MRFVEENEAAWSAEQLAAAEAQIEQQKREWELGRLQALKAEEERRLQEEELDEDLLTYSREDATNQVNDLKSKKSKPSKKRSQSSESEVESDESDTTVDTLSEEDEDENDLSDNDSDCEPSRKSRRNPGRSESYQSKNPISNSSRKTRSRGTVDINLWTLDENPILPGVKPVIRNIKDPNLLKRTTVRLVKLNGDAFDNKSPKRRLSSVGSNTPNKTRRNSSHESSDVDVISCNNDSNDSSNFVKTKFKGTKKNDSNGPVSPPTNSII